MKTKPIFKIVTAAVILFMFSCNNSTEEKTNNSDRQGETHQNQEEKTYSYPDNNVSAVPTELSKLTAGTKIDLRNSVYIWISTVENFDHKKPGYGNITQYEQPVFFIPYAIFNLAGNLDPMILESGKNDLQKCVDSGIEINEAYNTCYLSTFKNNIAYKVYSSATLQQVAYNWLLPEWKKSLSKMDSDKKRLISDILNHMIKYTANYNHKKELDFFNSCKNGKEYLFTSTYEIINGEPNYENGTKHPYRKAEAWVFRRINQNHMTAVEINNWLVKLKSDLQL
jgi:hypothetical protein